MKAEARSSTPMDEPAVEVPNRPLALALIVLGVTAGVAFVWYYARACCCCSPGSCSPRSSMAAPLLAVGRIAVLRFYVEDRLNDRPVAQLRKG